MSLEVSTIVPPPLRDCVASLVATHVPGIAHVTLAGFLFYHGSAVYMLGLRALATVQVPCDLHVHVVG